VPDLALDCLRQKRLGPLNGLSIVSAQPLAATYLK
jgi:hypothetical protein